MQGVFEIFPKKVFLLKSIYQSLQATNRIVIRSSHQIVEEQNRIDSLFLHEGDKIPAPEAIVNGINVLVGVGHHGKEGIAVGFLDDQK